ncbi:MAG: MFS transporter [Chloroflexi bacterium]|nr:MAG: MFS transporter [Chloroflexota bacterium]TME45518.1 MAG: MFS transporter [Chloroflexota bacterium]
MSAAAGKERGALRIILAERSVAAVIALALFINLGTGIVLPILPLYARSLGADYGQTGLMVGAYYFARLMSDIAAGAVLRRLGVRRAAAAGLSLLAIGALLTGLSPSFPIALICWAGAGAGGGTVFAAMYNALILGVAKERMARALSLFYGAFNGGVVAGGFLGGVVAGRFGLNVPLFCLAAIAAGLAAVMLRMLVESPHPALPQGGRETVPRGRETALRGTENSVRALFRIRGFGGSVISVLANLWMFGAVFNTLVPLFARDVLHLSTFGIGVLYAVSLAAEFAVYYPAGKWADSRGRRFVLIPAFALLAVATMILGWSPTVITFALVMALLGVASGFAGVPPAAMLADVLPEHESARGVATFRFGADLGYTLGPLVAGLTAASVGFKAAFITAGLPSVIALVVVTRGRETLPRSQTA